MSDKVINALNMIVNDFLEYAQEEGESIGLEWETIEGLKKLWTEEKEKFDEKMKKQVDEAFPKKVRSKKPKKDKNSPKKNCSAYIFFCNDKRSGLKKDHPDLNNKDVLKELGLMWKKIKEEHPEEVERFNMMANEDRDRYQEEMRNYIPVEEEKAEEKKRKTKKNDNKPKKGKSAYLFFCADERMVLKEEMPDLDSKDVLKELGARWKKLDSERVEFYQTLATEDKQRYKNELDNYVPIQEEPKEKRKAAPKKKKQPKKQEPEPKPEPEVEEIEEPIEEKTKEEIVQDIIDNFEGYTITKKMIKDELKKKGIKIEKDELNEIIANINKD